MASCELYYEEPVQRGTVRIVSIGISYENRPPENKSIKFLHQTVRDALNLSETLAQQAKTAGWEVATPQLLLQEGASRTEETFDQLDYASKVNLEKTLNEIKDSATIDDLTIITYSGHGIEETGELLMAHTLTEGAIDLSLPPSDPESIIVTPEWLYNLIRPIKGKKLLILDSCYSGLFIPESASSLNWVYDKGIDDWYGKYFSDEEYKIPSFMVLTASADSDSYEIKFDDHNHGVFTSALLAALGWNHTTEEIANGVPPAAQNEMLTIDSIYKYIKKNQTYPVRWSLFSIGENVQHPMVTGGAMDMLLFRY